jgi:hypothetical protein
MRLGTILVLAALLSLGCERQITTITNPVNQKVIAWRGEWKENTNYFANHLDSIDGVSLDGIAYIAISDSNNCRPPGPRCWMKLSAQ